jgi:hypothetical protein
LTAGRGLISMIDFRFSGVGAGRQADSENGECGECDFL